MNACKVIWPFDRRLSKSVASGSTRHKDRKHLIPRTETAKAKAELAEKIRAESGEWFRAHLTVTILVYMPRFLSDAVNFVDAIADAVRDGTGIDDKWFACHVDWRIDKRDPRIEICVIQSAREHQAWCPECEKLLPEDLFYFAKSRRMSTCRSCTKSMYQRERAADAAANGKVLITKRERERLSMSLKIKIHELRENGMTYQQIADELDISKSHAARAHKKLLSVSPPPV